MSDVLRASGATAISVSTSEEERLKFWSGRKNAFPASGRISPDYMCLDSTIPRKRLADILLAIQQMEIKYNLRCCNVFHAGDGNLHPLVLFDANDPDELHRCELFGADILETSVAMGGTVSGEHGVGVEKLNSMCVQFTAEENEQMFGVKRAFDRRACSTRARPSRRCSAAPSTASRCSAQGSRCRTATCRASEMKGLRGLAWLLVLQSIGELLSRGLSLPLPGPVLGLVLLLAALNFEPVREPVAECANFLLSHLSLLFIPVGVGVMTHLALLAQYGGRMLFVIALSTWIGLAVTATVLYWPDRKRSREEER